MLTSWQIGESSVYLCIYVGDIILSAQTAANHMYIVSLIDPNEGTNGTVSCPGYTAQLLQNHNNKHLINTMKCIS